MRCWTETAGGARPAASLGASRLTTECKQLHLGGTNDLVQPTRPFAADATFRKAAQSGGRRTGERGGGLEGVRRGVA